MCLVFPPKPDPPPVAENGGIQLDISPPTPQVKICLCITSSLMYLTHLYSLPSGLILENVSKLKVWYLDRAYDWHYLAPNFTAYFRMMLVHLGLPQWHLLLTPIGPTPWAKVIINF